HEPPVLLHPRPQAGIGERARWSREVRAEARLEPVAIEEGHVGRLSSRLERCRQSMYLSPWIRPSRKPRNGVPPRWKTSGWLALVPPPTRRRESFSASSLAMP